MGIAIVPFEEQLYLKQHIYCGRIERCSFDGSNITIIMTEYYLNAIAVDMRNWFVLSIVVSLVRVRKTYSNILPQTFKNKVDII